MKKKSVIILLLIFSSIIIYAQNLDVVKAILHIDDNKLFERIGLSETEIQAINEAKFAAKMILNQAQVELNLCKALLEQELYYEDVDMDEVENILLKSHEWRLTTEIAEIELYIKIRDILSRERLQQLVYEIQTMAQQQNRDNQNQ